MLFDYSAEAFKAAIDIKLDYDFGNNNLGVYYARQGTLEDLKLAEKYFRGALMSNMRYADAFNNLAIVLARQDKLDEAIFFHIKGLGVRDDRASDHNNLSRVYLQKYNLDVKNGDLVGAKRDLDSAVQENTIALRCDPNFLGARMTQVELYVKLKNPEEAATCVRRMMAIDAKAPESRQAMLMFVSDCLDFKRPDDAIDLLSESLKVNDTSPELYNARGLAYLLKGDLRQAVQDFERVVRLAPQFPLAAERLMAIRSRLVNPRP